MNSPLAIPAEIRWPNAWEMSDAELVEALKDPRWRIRNLYWIIDKDGHAVRFVPNEVQEKFIDDIWFRNVVPKARQRGFSTVVQILMLDACLFTSNTAAGIIAQDYPTALKIFRNKIKFAYDRLPQLIRDMVPLTKNNESEMMFVNGSSIYAAVSTRGGTLQWLHVSELGQISKKFPEKAREIQTGSLPSVDQNGIIVIESTVESAAGMFPDMCRRAQQHQQLSRVLSKMQYRLHFASWWDADEYETDPASVVISSTDHAYFERIEALIGRPLSLAKRAWYVSKRDDDFNGDWEKMKSQYPSILDEAFEVSQDGLWLGRQMTRCRTEKRILRLPYDPSKPVNFFWDIGVADDIAIWCHQEDGPWDNWIGFIEGSGEPYAYFIGELQKLGYLSWGKTWLPHDANHRRPGAEAIKTPADMIEGLGVRNIEIVPRTPDLVNGGIEDLRAAFARYRFDEEACAEGILHLDGYSKVWNERMGLWSSEVLKNGHQHAADALRQHAQVRHLIRPRRAGGRQSASTNAMTV